MLESASNNYITDSKLKAETFNAYFLSHNKINLSCSQLPCNNIEDVKTSVNSIRANEDEVFDQLRALKTGKATGPNKINLKLLKSRAINCSFFNLVN